MRDGANPDPGGEEPTVPLDDSDVFYREARSLICGTP
jgi:hypothetical protein